METQRSGKTALRLDLEAGELEARGQLKHLRYDVAGEAITLDDMLLVEDDAPAIGKPEGAADTAWFEKLHQGVMIRKDLVLEDARAFAGYLLFDGMEADYNDFPLYIRINGVELVRPPTQRAHPFARHYYTSDWGGSHFDNWFVVEVPVGALRQGNNEIVLWSESPETSWEIMVAADQEYRRGSNTRRRHPNRSAKSKDGGKTWDFDHLGWKDEIDGEYTLRLSLDRYVREGTYVSPVMDLAEGAGTVKKRLEIEACQVAWDVDVGEECSAEIRVRSGESPLPAAASWSPFEPVEGLAKTWSKPSGRYVQFEVMMRTENPLKTPALKRVSIETMVAEVPRESRGFYRLVEFKNGRVIRPSMEFAHEDFARLREIRDRFELDQVVDGAAGEFAAQLRLMRWTYEVPLGRLNPYAWNYYDLPRLERDEAGRIKLLGGYEERRRQGHCLYCNMTLIAACLAMGYPARWVNISTKHTYEHEVAEVWSNQFDKWVFLDATRDYYIYDPDTGIPMNLVEISARLAEIMPGPATWEHPIQWHLPDPALLEKVRIAYREGDHNYSIREPGEGPEFLMYKGHLQMPLRNDFASRPLPVPWRISSNWGGDLFYMTFGQ